MNKEGKSIKEIEENIYNLCQKYMKRENKQPKDIIHLGEKEIKEVREEIEKYINEEVPKLINKVKLVKSVRTRLPNRDLTSSEGTSGARTVESGEPRQKSSDEITEASSSTSRGVERRTGKAPISDSPSDKRFSQEIKKDLKIDHVTVRMESRGHHIIETKDVINITNRINNELESIKSALLKANDLSSDLKLDILSGIQDRRKHIQENWKQAITADEIEKGNKDKCVRSLEEDLKHLESIKKYVQEGEPLVGSKTVGLESVNRDSYFTNDKLRIFGVFDGVGKEEGSASASASASEFIESTLENHIFNDISLEQTKELIKRTLIGANNGLERQKKHNPELSGMATTALVANVMKDGTVIIGNVGDCRAFLIKRGSKNVEHLTLDNSRFNDYHLFNVMSLQHKMQIRDELMKYQQYLAQIKDFKQIEDKTLKNIIKDRNAIQKYLGKKDGFHGGFDVDMYEHKMERGDLLILASDGITDNLTDQEIHKIIRKNKWNPGKATEDLVQKAKEISKQVRPEEIETWEFRPKPDDMTVVMVTY